MEDVLHLHGLAYYRQRPVVCLDDLHVQLLGGVAAPPPMKEGSPVCYDYEYASGGAGVLLILFAPLTRSRLVSTADEGRELTAAASSSAWPRCSRGRTESCWCRASSTRTTPVPSASTCRPGKPSLWHGRSRCPTRRRRGRGSTWRSWSCRHSPTSACHGASVQSKTFTAECRPLPKSGTS